jgi:signal transduction histidine kinase
MALREGALRGLITLYVGFSAYLLARCLAYQHRTNREAVDRLLAITTMTSWASSADTIAQIIADLFHDPRSPITANVLTYDPVSNQLQVIGSSTADGRQLASTNYDFPADRGISGWAARHKQPCFINDTHNDPEDRFLAHDAFPHTRSALAVPFLLDNDQVAVLEVESAHTSDFAQEDLQLLQMIGSHLVISHRRNQLLDLHRNLAILGQELAERIIHVDDIGVMLERVGEVSLQLLKADLVSFYYRHPITGEIRERRIVGKLKVAGAGGSPLTEHDSLVMQLMQAREPRFFQHAQEEESLIRRRAWHEQVQHPPFVLREDILSCAAIPLVIGQECNGLMWVNYRHAKEFSEPLRNLIQLLAPYAAMAIQGGLRSALAEQERKNEARRMVHDSLAHRLRDMSRGMARLRECEPRSTSWAEEIHIVMLQLERAMHSVDNLVKQRANSTFALILADLTVNANLIHMTYHIPVTLDLCEAPEIPISANAADELLFACDEILGNATRHAQATTISIKTRQAHDTLIIEIADDGIGFDVSQVRPGQGVSNIRRRVVTLGGTANVISEPGAGTLVRLTVPLPRSGARILPL